MRRLVTWVLLVAIAATACDQADGETAVGRADVVTTTPVLADLVRGVAGDSLAVRSLIPAGADPHTFRLSELDFEAVSDAALVVVNGAGLEQDLSVLLDHAVEHERPVLVATSHLAGPVLTPDGHTDPHFWHDPAQMEAVARAVGDRLGRVDPGRARAHRAGARTLAREYRELGEQMTEVLAPVPERRRALVTQHDFFRYFARRFDFEVLGTVAPGLSSQGQPTGAGRLSLIETIDERELCAVFTSASTAGTLVEGIAGEAETDVQVVRVAADTLLDEGDYPQAMLDNARAVTAALTGCG